MQALQFLSSHRDTAVLLLKNEVDELSISVLEEIRLLVVLCSSVVHLAPRTELVSLSPFTYEFVASTDIVTEALELRLWCSTQCHFKPSREGSE